MAGGCLRDTFMDGEAKDIDIFLPHIPDVTGPLIDGLAKVFGWTAGKAMNLDYAIGFGHEVPLVQEFHVPGIDHTVQIVHLRVPRDVVFTTGYVISRMDFGACQIALDANGLDYSRAFLNDLQTHSFTLLRCESGEQVVRSIRRSERFAEKYPDARIDLSRADAFLMDRIIEEDADVLAALDG